MYSFSTNKKYHNVVTQSCFYCLPTQNAKRPDYMTICKFIDSLRYFSCLASAAAAVFNQIHIPASRWECIIMER